MARQAAVIRMGLSTVLILLTLAPAPAASSQAFHPVEPGVERHAAAGHVAEVINARRLTATTLSEMTRPSCYVSPAIEKTYIFIREIDSDGNPLNQLGGRWVAFPDQVPVVSETGKIVISYRQSSSDREYKMNPAICRGGNLISVP